jgi:hypothetical protein
MERLTAFNGGIWTMSMKAIADGYDRYSVFSRLAEYENTGLMPEEVKDLERKYQEDEHEYCGEYGTDDCQFKWKMQEMQKELDFWKREAIKSASQLGEIRLWLGSEGMEVDKVLEKMKSN